MKNVSLKKNIVMNYIRTVTTVLFPLISFPYAMRILLTEGIGKVNFVASVIVYLQMIASLGIGTYAIRQGTVLRDNKEKVSKFASEMLLINICATLVSYGIMFIILLIPKFQEYKELLLLYSLVLVFNVFSVDWLYSIFEDFTYVTLRAILFQVVSLVLLFSIVKSPSDLKEYVLITVISTAGSSVFNFIHGRKYINWLSLKRKYSIRKHLKPIFIIFGMTIATKVYLNMDTIMIGIFKSDGNVGLYTAAIKINTVLSTIITAISAVMLPRLSYYIGNNSKEKFDELVRQSLQYLMFATIPTIMGLFFVAKELIIVFSGIDFAPASVTMKIILPNLLCSILNGFIAYQIFMPCGKEKWALKATVCGAITNFCLNYILIPKLAQNGAAIATVITEIVVFIVLCLYSRKLLDIKSMFSGIWKYFLASTSFILIYVFLYWLQIKNFAANIILEIFFGGTLYLILLLLLRCDFLIGMTKEIKNRLWKV